MEIWVLFPNLEGIKNDEFLEHDKLRTIGFRNWNNTRTNSFFEMGKSSSNIWNVFKGSSLTGHRVRAY